MPLTDLLSISRSLENRHYVGSQEKLLVRLLVYPRVDMKLFTRTHYVYKRKTDFKGSRSSDIADKHYTMDRSEIITFFYVFPVEAILWRNYYRQRDLPTHATKLN